MKYPPYCLQPLPHPSRRNACQVIMGAPDGYWVEIKEETRSTEQNRLLWPLLTLWAKHQQAIVNGEKVEISKEAWKVILLHSFRKRHGRDQQFALGLDGDIVPMGYETHAIGKREFAEFLTFILAETGERRMELPARAEEECRGYIRRYIREVAA
jgi:sulfur carrier protein ThiS